MRFFQVAASDAERVVAVYQTISALSFTLLGLRGVQVEAMLSSLLVVIGVHLAFEAITEARTATD